MNEKVSDEGNDGYYSTLFSQIHYKSLKSMPYNECILSSKIDESDLAAINKGYIAIFIFTLNIPAILIGYGMTYQNQLTKCFNAKFGWKDDADKKFWQAILGCTLILG